MQERIDKFNDFIKVDSGRVKYFRYLTLADISTGAALVVLSWYIFAKAGVYGFIGAVFFNLGAADLFKIYIWRKAPYSKWVTWCSVALCALQALVALIILIYPFWYKSKILSAFEASITQAKQEFGSDVTVLQQYYTEGNFMIWIILLFSFLYLFFSVRILMPKSPIFFSQVTSGVLGSFPDQDFKFARNRVLTY